MFSNYDYYMKIGIVGLGHLGKIHLKLLKESEEFNVAAIYDLHHQSIDDLAKQHQTHACKSYEELLNLVEAVVIVTPTLTHHELASKAIKHGKHVFIEKPVTLLVEDAHNLIKLAREAGVVAQVGHVERYNPAFIASRDLIKTPYLIEAERSALYNVRGTDVSVVMDLMIHDIDLILSLVKSKVKRISATGKAIVSEGADIASAWIEFENGCMAKLSTNRISHHNIRKLDVFQEKNHIHVDMLNKTANSHEVLAIQNEKTINPVINTGNGKYELNSRNLEVHLNNAIKMELSDFYKSIRHGSPISVSLIDAESALLVADQIEKQIH